MKPCLQCSRPIVIKRSPNSRWGREKLAKQKYCGQDCAREAMFGTEQGFWARVERGAGCWEWQGYRNKLGYGRLKWHGRDMAAHRLAYGLTHKVTLTWLQFICHACDNPACCRPDHLFLGDAQANARDMVAKGRNKCSHVRGTKHGMAKLNEQAVREIRALNLPDYTAYRRAAQLYGVTPPAIKAVRQRITWAWVE